MIGQHATPDGDFREDWFGHNIPDWERWLAAYAGRPLALPRIRRGAS